MFFQMKFEVSKNFEQFVILHKIFFNWIVMLSSKSLDPESITAAMFTFPKHTRFT